MKAFRFGVIAVVAFVILGAWALRGQPQASETGFTAAVRDHVRAEQFAPVATVAGLPANVRDGLNDLFGGRTLEMADPGQPFQATDVMVTPRLPARRLVSAGCSTDHCLVYYERGGFARVHHIALFGTADAPARLIHGGVAAGGLADLEQVRDALVSGKVAVDSKYW